MFFFLLNYKNSKIVYLFAASTLATQEDVDCTTSTPKEASTDDDFEQLRMVREKERIERQKHKIARSVSQQTGGSVTLDTDLLLEQLTNSRSDGLNRQSFYDPNA